MWPFRKKSTSQYIVEIMPEIEELVCERWTHFDRTLVFKDGVPLEEKFFMFAVPMIEGIKNAFPKLRNEPETVYILLIARGVVRSGTVTKEALAESTRLPIEVLS